MYKSSHSYKGPPESTETGDRSYLPLKANKQVHTYIKSLLKLKTLFQLEINEVKAGNAKNKFPNWQKITRNNELLEKITGAKIHLSRISEKVYSQNPPFTKAEIKAIDAEILKLLEKGRIIKPPIHEIGESISPIFVTTTNDGGYRLILNQKNFN